MGTLTKLETLEDLINEHMDFAKKCFEDRGEYQPMVIGYSGTSRYVVGLSFENDFEKMMALSFVKMLFIAKGVKRYTIANEGYMLEGSSKEEYDELRESGKRISEHPNHIEVLQTMAISHTESRLIIYKITAEKTLEKFLDDKEMIAAGLFAELLPPDNIPQEIVDAIKFKFAQVEQQNVMEFEETPLQ